jgi:hypothetical protein
MNLEGDLNLSPDTPLNETGSHAGIQSGHAQRIRLLLNHSSGMYSGTAAESPTLDAVPLASWKPGS